MDLGESIAREYEWVLQTIAGTSLSGSSASNTTSVESSSTRTRSSKQ
jgi:hypothetical protein